FKNRAEEALGHTIEVVSGREEARLVYSGVAHSSPQRGEKLLVVDIGGGSTELIAGEGFTPSELFSLQMGCVSITRRFFPDGRMTAKRVKKARIAARVELEPIVASLRALSWDEAIGASGTIRAAAEVMTAQGGGRANKELTPEGLTDLIRRMVDAGEIRKLSMPGLDPERAPVFPGGMIVLESIFKELGIDSMRVSDGALREGILFDLVGRITHEDARERSIRSLQQRYNIDLVQAQHVEETAVTLLRSLADQWDLTLNDQELLLRWAARCHELGLAIAHSGFHRHGAYLLENSDLPGFSTFEQARLATLVALHRKRFREEELERIRPDRRAAIRKLAIILRIAVVLHRGRSPELTPRAAVKAAGRKLKLNFGDDWLAAHPLTRADLEREARYLGEADLKLEVV
ncbi:MAG: Ppx/GppA family phosphatase, partial [Gammaproteobacteria bacterium]|nr:Ppx/GppA family phosphatase [Gammaproteobacteria bacterium]